MNRCIVRMAPRRGVQVYPWNEASTSAVDGTGDTRGWGSCLRSQGSRREGGVLEPDRWRTLAACLGREGDGVHRDGDHHGLDTGQPTIGVEWTVQGGSSTMVPACRSRPEGRSDEKDVEEGADDRCHSLGYEMGTEGE